MFKKNEYVMHDTRGVCQVEDVTPLDFSEKEKLYYKLVPVFDRDTILYVPVCGGPTGKISLRPVITRDEALELIRMMPEIEAKSYTNFKEQAQICREILYSGDQRERIALMKGIFKNGMKRKQSGKTLSANERESQKVAEAFLYGELAVALDIPVDQVEDYIAGELKKTGAAEQS